MSSPPLSFRDICKMVKRKKRRVASRSQTKALVNKATKFKRACRISQNSPSKEFKTTSRKRFAWVPALPNQVHFRSSLLVLPCPTLSNSSKAYQGSRMTAEPRITRCLIKGRVSPSTSRKVMTEVDSSIIIMSKVSCHRSSSVGTS